MLKVIPLNYQIYNSFLYFEKFCLYTHESEWRRQGELEVLVKWATNDNCYNPPHTHCHTRHFLRQKKDLKSIFPFALFLTTQLIQKKGIEETNPTQFSGDWPSSSFNYSRPSIFPWHPFAEKGIDRCWRLNGFCSSRSICTCIPCHA